VTIDEILERLRADPASSVSSTPPKNLPADRLPDDVRRFFGQTLGGYLYYAPDYPTPQFGCDLGLASQPVSQDAAVVDHPFCVGTEFDFLFPVASYREDGLYYSIAGVSVLPESFGHIFRLSYDLGDPELQWSDVQFQARSFNRWLSIHVEAWERYQEDWRGGLRLFRELIAAEKKAMGYT
jgi:hypothetical protein